MSGQQRASSTTLLAAAAGIGVALLAGAITLAISQPRQSAASAASKPAGRGAHSAKRELHAASSARTRMAKRRRGAWLEASAGKGLELKTLQDLYFDSRKRVASSKSDQRFQRGEGHSAATDSWQTFKPAKSYSSSRY